MASPQKWYRNPIVQIIAGIIVACITASLVVMGMH